MAETFWCKEERVKFSNGATEILIGHWLSRAEARSAEAGMEPVVAFLRQRLAIPDGFRAFGMDREAFPSELATADCVAALASLIRETAQDATQIPEITWDPHHQEWWQSRLWNLYTALIEWQDTVSEQDRTSLSQDANRP